MGLGKGANYKNTLVVSDKGIVENELRFEDEFLKHKVLDLIGDLYLTNNFLKVSVACLSFLVNLYMPSPPLQ